MKITETGRQLTVRESQKEMAARKLSKFDRIFGDGAEAFVTFSARHDKEIIEIMIRQGGTLFRSEERSDTFNNAMDEAIESLERQIRKNKTRLQRQLRDTTLIDFGQLTDTDVEEETEFKIRRKSFPFKPISPEEAILQMNLLEHDFFVFLDAESGDPSVVYKRRYGDYGLLTPSEE